jgi:hypothetical protein
VEVPRAAGRCEYGAEVVGAEFGAECAKGVGELWTICVYSEHVRRDLHGECSTTCDCGGDRDPSAPGVVGVDQERMSSRSNNDLSKSLDPRASD